MEQVLLYQKDSIKIISDAINQITRAESEGQATGVRGLRNNGQSRAKGIKDTVNSAQKTTAFTHSWNFPFHEADLLLPNFTNFYTQK